MPSAHAMITRARFLALFPIGSGNSRYMIMMKQKNMHKPLKAIHTKKSYDRIMLAMASPYQLACLLKAKKLTLQV